MPVHVFSVPLVTQFRGIRHREGALLAGPAGYGEFSPFVEYSPAVSARWLSAAREAAAGDWPAPVRDRVPVNVTVPAVPPGQAARIVVASGCRTAKVKVAQPGQTDDDDVARVAAVRDALGPGGRIRVDANAAWSVEQAVHVIRRLEVHDLEYVEQPCARLEDMTAVRRAVRTPLAADELVRLAVDPLHVPGLREAADIVILKVQPLGGVRAALRVAEAAGLPAVVSSAVETSVGLAAGVALAAALPELSYACGLGTGLLLGDDVVTERLLPVDGYLAVRPVSVDPVALLRCAASPERTRWWHERLASVDTTVATSVDTTADTTVATSVDTTADTTVATSVDTTADTTSPCSGPGTGPAGPHR